MTASTTTFTNTAHSGDRLKPKVHPETALPKPRVLQYLTTVTENVTHVLCPLGLVLRYVPPMADNDHGIRLTRSFELPFPPTEKMVVFSKEGEGQDDPMGYVLKEVTWDIDRGFLAETQLSSTGVPIALIPLDIRRLVDFGWQFGSFKDRYETDGRRVRKRKKLRTLRISKWDDDEATAWEIAAKKSRPQEFTIVLHALVSTMAELRNNSRVAVRHVEDWRICGFAGSIRAGSPYRFPAEIRRCTRRFRLDVIRQAMGLV